jgi:hypothetical protein
MDSKRADEILLLADALIHLLTDAENQTPVGNDLVVPLNATTQTLLMRSMFEELRGIRMALETGNEMTRHQIDNFGTIDSPDED